MDVVKGKLRGESTKIRNLIDKHQSQADKFHELAESLYKADLKKSSATADQKAHIHEVAAMELRLALK